MNIEIERKFLLKTMPVLKPSEIIKIEQWYFKNSEGIWERARYCNSNIKGKYYIHTIKTTISKGVNMEDEHVLTKEEYELFVENCKREDIESRTISKKRCVYPQGKLKWEVDKFDGHLIIAEIEIPNQDYEVLIPDYIKNIVIIEVTGIKQFSNKNLSNKIINLTT